MNFAHLIREIGRGKEGARDLDFSEAQQLYGAMLDGGVSDVELGAILIALRMKGEVLEELAGFIAATNERLTTFDCPRERIRPVVIPSYNGARKGANLTPLLAMLLQRFGIPVLIHGLIEGYGRVTSAQILREFGIMPVTSRAHANQHLQEGQVTFVPLSVISPGLAQLLAMRSRLGLRNTAHSLVKMIDPFAGRGLVLASATHPEYLDLMRELLAKLGASALLLRATEGEPVANPKRRPRIEYLHDGAVDLLFDAEHESLRSMPHLPEDGDTRSTVDWMHAVLAGVHAIPAPLANQLACCLYASGYADDFNQAKAIVAVDAMN